MARRSTNICLNRKNQSLCDLEIVAGNGTGEDDDETEAASPILATKVFLYDISDKWKELIQSARKTLTQGTESAKDKIFIPQIQREIMENIIDFIYAGLRNEIRPLPLDDYNVEKYFEAAQFLEMEDVEAKCLSYFGSKKVTLENFSVLFKWSSTFGKEAIQPKMRTFLTQHSQQIPEIIRRCKNKLNFRESEVALILIDWLSFCSNEGENCYLSVKQVIRQFSDKSEKIKLLKAFFEAGDSDWSKAAFRLLLNLYKHSDSDSVDNTVEDAGTKSASVPPPPKSKSKKKSVSFSLEEDRTPSKSKSGATSSSNASFSGCQQSPKASTSKSSAPPAKKRRLGNNSSRSKSKLNSAFVQLERIDDPKRQQQKQKTKIQNESDSDSDSWSSASSSESFSSSSSASSCSSESSSSSSCSSESSIIEIKRTVAKNTKAQGIIYFLLNDQNSPGGFYFWFFDLNTKKSGQEAKLPPSFRDRRSLAMVYGGNAIYFMGGESSRTGKVTKEVCAFDLKSREWAKVDMMDHRYDFGACVLNGNIYAVGGYEESPSGPKLPGVGINTVEMLPLEPRTRAAGGQMKWKEVDCMESCRAHAGIVALDGKIYAIGGEVWNPKVGKLMSASDLCEVFDPRIHPPRDQWNPMAPMKYKRHGLAAVTTTEPHPNRIYALGGTLKNPHAKKSANSQALNIVEIYDPDEDSWKKGPPMKKPRKFFSAVYSNNCIYALGGDSVSQPTMEKFDLRTKKWTLEGNLKKEGNFETVAFEPL